jgi:hypothetical protein
VRSSPGTNDCTPIDSRFTPQRAQASSRPGFTVSGFASSVTSAPGASVKRDVTTRQTRSKWRGEIAEGVPPPKNSELNSRPAASGARRSASTSRFRNQRSTAAEDRWSFEK